MAADPAGADAGLINEYKSRFIDGKHLAEVTGKYQQEVDDRL